MKGHVLQTIVSLALVSVGNISVVYSESRTDKPEPTMALTNGEVTIAGTGLEFQKMHSVVGESDVIKYPTGLNMSPNGKFLLWNMHTIPFGGGRPMRLVDFIGLRGTWSPDGKRIAFYSGGIWVVPVSPETGRPTGPPKKLIDGNYNTQEPVSWSPDSDTFVFCKDQNLWTYSIQDGSAVQITDDPVFKKLGGWSPDGKSIVYGHGDESIYIVPAKGGRPRKLVDIQTGPSQKYPAWAPDGNWIFYQSGQELTFVEQGLYFVRVADGLRVDIPLPEGVGSFLSWSPDGEKMLFYSPSYDWSNKLKVVSVFGGASFEPAKALARSDYDHQWSQDSKFITTWGGTRGKFGYWVVPLGGDAPFLLKLDVSAEGQLVHRSISPDGTKMVFSYAISGQDEEYRVVPISLQEGKTTGLPINPFPPHGKESCTIGFAWSPDGAKLAVLWEDDLWIAHVDGRPPIRLTDSPERELMPQWSPTGTRVAWIAYSQGKSALKIVSVPGEKPTTLLESPRWLRYEWSPDGTRIACREFSLDESVLRIIPLSAGEPTVLVDTDSILVRYAWSPNGKELAAQSDDRIVSFSFPGGKRRVIADLKEMPLRRCYGVWWSPDGKTIAFVLGRLPGDPPTEEIGAYRTRICTVPAGGGKPTELASDDAGAKYFLFWSPDSKWISYNSVDYVKTRSEGVVWEVQIDEYLKREAEKATAGSSASKD